MRRFLQATPYVEHDYFSFNGVINEEVFYEHLYYESKSIENKKQELYDSIVTDSGINTFFILGYQGCGCLEKTSHSIFFIIYGCNYLFQNLFLSFNIHNRSPLIV